MAVRPVYIDEESGERRVPRPTDDVDHSPKHNTRTSAEIDAGDVEDGFIDYDTDENRAVVGSLKRYLVGIRDTGKKINTIADLEGDTPSWFETLFSATPKRDMLGYNTVGDGGGGPVYWDADQDKQNHNGGTIFSDTWDNGTYGDTSDANWYSADPSDTGTGCWVRDIINDINVQKAGATLDGVTDDYIAIQATIDLLESGVVTISDGTALISQPLTVNSNVILNLTASGIIKPNADINVVNIDQNAFLFGDGEIDITDVSGYSSSAISVLPTPALPVKKTGARGITLTGIRGGDGRAINLSAFDDGTNISFTSFENINMKGFNQGIYLFSESNVTNQPFVNSNRFSHIVMEDCVSFITTDGGNACNANIFDEIVIQSANGISEKAIQFLNGDRNRFTGTVWDWHDAVNDIGINITASCENCRIDYRGGAGIFRNNSLTSEITCELDKSIPRNIPLAPAAIGDGRETFTELNDMLAFADFRHTVSSTVAPDSGSLPAMFQIENTQEAEWDSTTIGSDVQVEIDLDSVTSQLRVVGVQFTFGWPKNITIEVFDETSGSYIEIFSETDNTNFNIYQTTTQFGALARDNISGIRITFSESATNSLQDFVRITRVFAYSQRSIGHSYLKKDGGEVYGDIVLNGQNPNEIAESLRHFNGRDVHSATDLIDQFPEGMSFTEIVNDTSFPESLSGTLITVKPRTTNLSFQIFKPNGNNSNRFYYRAYSASGVEDWADWRSPEQWVGGNTANRPSSPLDFERYFDTDLGHPIWFDGSNWVDATGTTV